MVTDDCLGHNMSLEAALLQALLEIGLLREHVEPLVERTGDLDRRTAHQEGTAARPIDGSWCPGDALLYPGLAECDQTAQTRRRIGKAERRRLVAPIGVDDDRRGDGHLGVRVEIRHERVECAGLDRRVVVENQVIVGSAVCEQPIMVGAEAGTKGLLDQLDGWVCLANGGTGSVL